MVNLGTPDGELDLHLDGAGFEAEISDGGDGRGHQRAAHPANANDSTAQTSPLSSAARNSLAGGEARPRGPSRKRLARTPALTTCGAMITREQWRRFIDQPVVEWAMFVRRRVC